MKKGYIPVFATKVANSLKINKLVSDNLIITSKSQMDKPYKLAELKQGKRLLIEYKIWDCNVNALKRVQHTVPYDFDSIEEKNMYIEVYIEEINKKLEAGHVIGQKEVKYPKLKDALHDVLAVKIASSRHRTKLTYTSVINIFVEFLNQKNYDLLAKDFSQKHLYEFRDYLLTEKKVANKTANNYLGHLKVFFNALVAREIIEKSPIKGVLNLQTTVGSSNIAFTKDEQNTLEQYLIKNEIGLYYFTRFIYYGFIRPKELLELQIRHIDLDKNKITLPANISKNKKQEWVTIPKALQEVITKMKLDVLPKNYYIFSKDLLPGLQAKHRNTVTNLHSQVLKKTNMYNGNLTLYSWKHTGVCNAYKAGLDIVSLQKQLRHHSLAMTEIYLKSLSLIDNDNVLNANW